MDNTTTKEKEQIFFMEVLKSLTALEHAGERINGRSYLCEDLISEIHLFRNAIQEEYIQMLDE